jgi:hypothetical protein
MNLRIASDYPTPIWSFSSIKIVKERFNLISLTSTACVGSGGYRSRTDDPLRARQVLWPAELNPRN